MLIPFSPGVKNGEAVTSIRPHGLMVWLINEAKEQL
jgi:hypothetical protein